MKKELQEKLYTDFPKLYVQGNLDPSQSAMHWGFQCDDGWYDLIYNLSDCVQRYIDYNQKYNPDIQQVEVTCVKEKFGGLCWYVINSNEYIRGIILFANHMSLKTCEKCGSQGKLRIKDKCLYKTVCDKCAQELRFDDIDKNSPRLTFL